MWLCWNIVHFLLQEEENGLGGQLYDDYNGNESASGWEGDSDRDFGDEGPMITQEQEVKQGLG